MPAWASFNKNSNIYIYTIHKSNCMLLFSFSYFFLVENICIIMSQILQITFHFTSYKIWDYLKYTCNFLNTGILISFFIINLNISLFMLLWLPQFFPLCSPPPSPPPNSHSQSPPCCQCPWFMPYMFFD